MRHADTATWCQRRRHGAGRRGVRAGPTEARRRRLLRLLLLLLQRRQRRRGAGGGGVDAEPRQSKATREGCPSSRGRGVTGAASRPRGCGARASSSRARPAWRRGKQTYPTSAALPVSAASSHPPWGQPRARGGAYTVQPARALEGNGGRGGGGGRGHSGGWRCSPGRGRSGRGEAPSRGAGRLGRLAHHPRTAPRPGC